jgi:hypothetical protein
MSNKQKDNFIDLCLRGEVLMEEIDDWVDEWHDSPQEQELYEFLGMNWDEYSSWVSIPETLPVIVTAHKENRNFMEMLVEFQALPMAARAETQQKAHKLVSWLKAQNII